MKSLMIILLIPLGEGTEAGTERGGGAEAEILFQWRCVSVCYRDVADTTPLERDFNFRPNTPLRQGLQAFASWYKSYKK